MDARYYDPVIGRFYSNDPIGFRDVHSFNRYAYANNNPYKYVDPSGMISEEKRKARKNKSYDKCEKDPNCNNLITPDRIIERDYGSVSAELRSYSGSGNNQQGNIACSASCLSAANAAFQFSEIELLMGHMRMNYLMGQSTVFRNGSIAAGALGGVGAASWTVTRYLALTASEKTGAFLLTSEVLGVLNGPTLRDAAAYMIKRSPTMVLKMRLKSTSGKPKIRQNRDGSFRFVAR